MCIGLDMLFFFPLLLLDDDDRAKLYRQLCDLVEPTPVGEVLKQVDERDCEDFYKNYLHDFVRMVHRCHQNNQDYEIQEYEVIKTSVLEVSYIFFC